MHNTKSAAGGPGNPVARGRAGILVSFLLALSFLPAGHLAPVPAAAASGQQMPEIAVDNADIGSPQATLASLIRLTDVIHELVEEDGVTSENRARLTNIYQQIQKLFDLREIPPKYRRHVSAESAVYLREALARFPVPPMDEIPDEEFYRLPGTPVVIRKTDTGAYEGNYQFSSATVTEAKNWYEAAKTYPYLEGQGGIAGLHDDYFLTPGPMISVRLIRALPGWMQVQFLDQGVWQWLMLIATVFVLVGLMILLRWLLNRISRRMKPLQQNLVLILWPIGVVYLTLGARSFLQRQVFLSGEVLQDVLFVAKLIILAAAVYLVMRLGNVLMEFILSNRQFETRKIEQQLVRLGIRMITILIAVIVVIEGMQQIGFSLATLVAGAGVTGLAIALAAQDTLKNVFGGLLLAMDRPFEAGQRVKMKGYDGFIQEVGLRSTKIRTLNGHQIIIPNDEAARMEVENIGRRPNIRRDLNVTITYDTPPEKIARAVEILQEILAVPISSADGAEPPGKDVGEPHPNEAINRPDFPPRVHFSDLNADSLNLLVVYWFHPPDPWMSLEFAQRVNLQIMERFNAEGIDFAFPSQTVYLAGDSKRPLTPGHQPFQTPAATTQAAGHAQPAGPGAEKSGHAPVEENLVHGEDEGEDVGSTG